ncbi:hypothetical protein I3842_13G122700 [Carya illinoinensis]|uniref:Uncharacterized protein n=1 Tax=Carya illinoinensis TaxID=32201 RepID=A0A922AMB1_CARIL|nr:hypothetical protein I3842_13G122700 [Carya illinoinensis]
MGNRHILPSSTANNLSKKRSEALPIETMFRLPSPLPVWPKLAIGQGFATGIMDLGGGLHMCQISTLDKVWATHEGGLDNLGATLFEPSRIPDDFSMLGCYSQHNNKPFFGWVLVGKDDGSSGDLRKPLDYTLIWSSESSEIKRDGNGYVWLPIPPEGYKAIGHVVTNSPQKAFLDKIKCIRANLTDQCEANSWIWGPGKASNANGFNVYDVRPSIRGVNALGVSVGTFVAQLGGTASPLSIACLKNAKSNLSSMPNLMQIDALMRVYSPWVYFHPDEEFLPSSMRWFFVNGAMLYSKGEESNPGPIEPNGSNLYQGGSNNGAYWLDLPVDVGAKERVKKGDLGNFQVYVHVKLMLGASFTDLAIWMFYPFNGPAKAKVRIVNVSLGKIAEHVLQRLYFSEHSGGTWLEAFELEFQNGNKIVAYTSLHGHAFGGIGIRNDTGKSKRMLDTGRSYSIMVVEYLGSAIIEPTWLKYCRKWGPKISYDVADEIRRGLPNEVLGEEGPMGPNMKNNWTQDEV